MRRSIFTLFTLALVAVPLTADAEYRDLCMSVPAACEYTPANVPTLLADVCYSLTSTAIRLKGTAPCPSGSKAFNVIHGEVLNAATGEVAAYAPLDDACAAGHCAAYVAHDNPQESGICCENGGPCWGNLDCDGILYWCYDGVCNEDGTVTCFDAELM